MLVIWLILLRRNGLLKVCFTNFLGQVVVTQVFFSGKGITSHMAPKVAAENIKNLIISCTEKVSQDNNSLLDAYKKFDKNLKEENI